MLEYDKHNNVMYSYNMHEKDWLTRYKLRVDGKFQDEELYEWEEDITTEQIHTMIDWFWKW